MTTKKNKSQEKEVMINPLSYFFSFQNKETYNKLLAVIKENEPVGDLKVDRYVLATHQIKKSDLLIQFKNYLRNIWRAHPELVFSDFKGLIDLGLLLLLQKHSDLASKITTEMVKKEENNKGN